MIFSRQLIWSKIKEAKRMEAEMKKNKVQFQKGLSEEAFRARYGTEEQCRAELFSWRWPDGFICPACQGTVYKGQCILRSNSARFISAATVGIRPR
jgi:hypothetical protein